MTSFLLRFLFLIPIGLVIVAGELIRKRGNPETASRRYFLFLIWTSLAAWSVFTYINWGMSTSSLGSLYNAVLAPLLIGLTTLSLLNLREWQALVRREKLVIVTVLICLILSQIWLAGIRNSEQWKGPLFFEAAILVGSLILYLVWIMGNRYLTALVIISFIYLLLFNILEGGALPFFESGIEMWLAVTAIALYVLLPALVLPTASMMLLHLLQPGMTNNSFRLGINRIGQSVVLLMLLISLLYTIVWLCIWDGTDDGIRGLLMIILSILISTAAAVVITMSTTSWRRWSGFVLAILVGFGVTGVVAGPGNWYHVNEITDARAASLQKAIEDVKKETGAYPVSLGGLVPAKIWRIPRPMIVRGEAWCYESGPDYYRLGTVYREHWSSPYLSVRLYASAGNLPEGTWSCDERLRHLIDRQGALSNLAPKSAPLPTSVVPIGRTRVAPSLEANQLAVGDWSVDGKSLVFGLTSLSNDREYPVQLDLRFIDGNTGEICQPVQSIWKAGARSDGLYQHYAWLPDGRLLYVSEEGKTVAYTPCAENFDDLSERIPVRLTQVVASAPERENILLKNKDAYWLLGATTFGLQRIDGVKPATAENQNDRFGWSPDGNRLAVAKLIGQNASEGATIDVINANTGEVEMTVPLTGPSDYVDAPVIDWLNTNEILVQFAESLLILDLRSDPLGKTDLVRDKFKLDLAYPVDFSSMDFVRNADGVGYSIGVRVNHPHNQNVYLYDSETGQVSVFQHDTYSILVYPDGQCMRLMKLEDAPTYSDQYEIVFTDRPTEKHRLVLEGHTPRNYSELFPRCLSGSSELVFNSSQGVSLVSVPGGETIRFWELAQAEDISTRVLLSPSEDSLVVVADGKRLYYVSLPPR